MKKLILPLLFICSAIMITVTSVQAQTASRNEALTVASNWITMIIQKQGDWGGYETAEIDEIHEFKRGGRVLGYFFRVKPKGYIIVSRRKEMAPVKAFSARSDLNPESEEGMADLLKGQMEGILDKIEQAVALEKADGAHKLTDVVEINYRPAWENLESDVKITQEELQGDEGSLEEDFEFEVQGGNYQQGQVMLSSSWGQEPPENNDCPWLNCTNTSNGRARVGCAAVAGAQIMRYWNWPPYGVGIPYNDTYDWSNMMDTVSLTPLSPPVQQAAVAELCHEVGLAVGMKYGCTGSSADMFNMVGVYRTNYRYVSHVNRVNRSSYSAVDWFEMLKYEFNNNRPVQYRVSPPTGGHAVVADGWLEIGTNPIQRFYHMNWGQNSTTKDVWYALDSMSVNPVDEEYVVRTIYPYPSAYEGMQGSFPRESFPYRYFPIDLSLTNPTVFQGGQRLQFLPNIVLGYSGSSGSIRIEGSNSYDSHLFTRGDLTKGVRIYKNSTAVIKINQNGSLKFN